MVLSVYDEKQHSLCEFFCIPKSSVLILVNLVCETKIASEL